MLSSHTLPKGPFTPFTSIAGIRAVWIVIASALVLMLLRVPFGYGEDGDTYAILGTWQRMLLDGVYEPSRFQGYIVAEFIIGFLAQRGGAMAANMGVLLFALASFVFTFLVAKQFHVRTPLLVVALLVTNPLVIIASSISMDYMIAYAFFISGLYFYMRGMPVPALVLFALCVGSRLPYFALIVIIVMMLETRFAAAERTRLANAVVFLVALLIFAGAFYLPTWISASLGFDWLSAAVPDQQGWLGLFIRFVYKSVYFVGPFALALAAVAVFFELRQRPLSSFVPAAPDRTFFYIAAAVILFHALMFLQLPTDPSFYIPSLPFMAILLLLMQLEGVVWALVVGQIVFWAVSVNFLQIDYMYLGENECGPMAVGGRVAASIEPGPLLEQALQLEDQDRCHLRFLVIPYDNYNDPLPVSRPLSG